MATNRDADSSTPPAAAAGTTGKEDGDVPDLFKCSICWQPFDDGARLPKLLPCHHTFCLSCLHKRRELACCTSCPLCRKKTCVEELRNLTTNFYICKFRKYLMKMKERDPYENTVECVTGPKPLEASGTEDSASSRRSVSVCSDQTERVPRNSLTMDISKKYILCQIFITPYFPYRAAQAGEIFLPLRPIALDHTPPPKGSSHNPPETCPTVAPRKVCLTLGTIKNEAPSPPVIDLAKNLLDFFQILLVPKPILILNVSADIREEMVLLGFEPHEAFTGESTAVDLMATTGLSKHAFDSFDGYFCIVKNVIVQYPFTGSLCFY